jgi:hypothetical protein
VRLAANGQAIRSAAPGRGKPVQYREADLIFLGHSDQSNYVPFDNISFCRSVLT